MNVFKMAWRNIWRNTRRSVVSIAAMAFALFVLVQYGGLVNGYMHGMTADLIELGTGDMQIFHPEYRVRPSIYSFLEDSEGVIEQLDEAGYKASAQLLGGGLVAAGDFSSGASFIGIDVARDAQVSRVYEKLAEGAWVDPTAPKGVVIGKRLAKTLDVKIGDELVVLSQATDGSMANDLFEIRGVLGTVGSMVDRVGVFMNDSTFRELMSLPAGAHQIVVRLAEGVDPAEGKAAVETMVGVERVIAEDGAETMTYPKNAVVLTWKELFPSMATMLESVQGMIYLLFFIFYLAIGILILNSMLMAVFERVKEFGVLKAIGLEPSKVLQLIMLEATAQIALAVVVGLLVALPGMWYLSTQGIDMGGMGGMNVGGMSMSQIWYGIYTVEGIQVPVMMLIIMAGAAAIYPALKAAFIQPIEAMRHQ